VVALNQTSSMPVGQIDGRATRLLGHVPLIGREAELDEISSAFKASKQAAVVIAGRAGVGKSRLAAEVAGAMATGGWATEIVIVTAAAAAVPFGPFAALLPEVAALASDPLHLLQTATAAIAGRARNGHPLLLVVDDAHLLDAGSATLVHQLVQNRACGLIATVRTPDLSPEPIISLWKDALALRIDVETLMRDETDTLVIATLGGPVAASARRWLWKVSAGNPLFVRELLIGGQESRSLYSQGGIWFLHLPLPAPARLTDLIAARLSNIAPETAEVVDLLAVGEPLSFDVLRAMTGRDPIEDAERHGLLVMRDDGRRSEVRLSHPLYTEMLRAKIPAIRLRRLSLKLAEALEATPGRRRDDVLRLGLWRLEAGALSSPELLVEAARRARAARNSELAGRLARAALSAGAGVTAGLILGEVEFLAGRHEEGERILAGLVPSCRTDEERILIANARAYNLGTLMGDQVAAAAVIDQVLSVVREPTSHRWLLARQAITDVWAGRLTAGLHKADELADNGDDGAMRRGANASSIALALLGRTEGAVATAYRARDSHRRGLEEIVPGAPLAEFQPPEAQLIGAVIGHLVGGRLASADADARLAIEVALDVGDREFLATFSLLRGCVQVERGLLADASLSFREAAAINRDISDMAPLRWCLAGVSLAEAMAGNAAAAADSEADLAALPPHWMRALDPLLVERCHPWVLVASGRLTDARARLREAADSARAGEQYGAEAFLLHDQVRLGNADSVLTRLRELTQVVDGDLIPAFAAHAAARVKGDGPSLEAAARGFETTGALLLAAEAVHAAAAAYAAAGSARQASAMTRESARLRALCGTPGNPLIVNVDAMKELTKREFEIAVLAASGLSSKAVADRLHLSVRTVDNHLQHIYSKLGITTRSSLQAVLREP
jgi:DNA-binding CsgD family transcriptional regulator